MSTKTRYRLVTRSDFDGLVCAVLLKEVDLIDEILFVHPKDMQDGKIEVGAGDITTNLPYVPGAHLAFDHHASEVTRLGERPINHIIEANAPSAARVVYAYYGGKQTFTRISDEMMRSVDQADSAQYSLNDILDPRGWTLMNFLMDARTGLGRFRDFRISNYQLMMQLIDYCRDHTINEILNLPDVKERADLYYAHRDPAREQILRCTKSHGNTVVIDLRHEDVIYATNRFQIYALFPLASVSIHVLWGREKQNTVLAVGKSILNRSAKVHVGDLCLQYGGGGHAAAGTCQIDNDLADKACAQLVEKIAAAQNEID